MRIVSGGKPGGASTNTRELRERDAGGPAAAPLLVNERQRSVKCPGLFGARIRAGTIREELAGIGDTVIADPWNGIYAIADSSDRDPAFGRDFMLRFLRFISGFGLISSGATHKEETARSLTESIVLEAEATLLSASLRGTCAFTGLCLVGTDRGIGAMLFHAGDTMLFVTGPGQRIHPITKSNFWFVGKASHFFQAEYLEIEPGMRLLFTTDGFDGPSPLPDMGSVSPVEHAMKTSSIEDIPDILLGHYGGLSGRDDAAVVSLNPEALPSKTGRIILGGTTAAQERDRKSREPGMPDEYRPYDERNWEFGERCAEPHELEMRK